MRGFMLPQQMMATQANTFPFARHSVKTIGNKNNVERERERERGREGESEQLSV